MRYRSIAVLMVLVWVLLWDTLTLGHLLGGVVVAASLLVLLRSPHGAGGVAVPFRPVAIARLLFWFARQVIISNAQVARATLFPRRYVRPGVVRVPLRTSSVELAALIANLTALSPGMQPIDSTREPLSLDVHVLTLDSEDAARALVERLEDHVLAAFGTDDRGESS